MSWSSRLSRFSPFGRSNTTSTNVADSDFSYINPTEFDAHLSRPKRETDVLIFRHKKVSYPIHFPAYSIDDGKLTTGGARDAVARKLADNVDPRRVRMFWKGRNLKDDAKAMRDEGLTSDAQAEILCVVGEPVASSSAQAAPAAEAEDEEGDSDSDGEGADGTSTPNGTPTAPKRKRNRNRKKNKNKGKSNTGTGTSTPTNPGALPGGGVPLPLPQTPLTPQGKLAAIAVHFRTSLLPLLEAYVRSPPTDKAKRDLEHRKLTETTLQQVLLKVDGIDTEGMEEVRTMRKELVREVQGWLNRMDDIVKGA